MNQKTDVMSALRQWLRDGDYSSILELARNKKRILSLLTVLTYDENQTIRDRAIQGWHRVPLSSEKPTGLAKGAGQALACPAPFEMCNFNLFY